MASDCGEEPVLMKNVKVWPSFVEVSLYVCSTPWPDEVEWEISFDEEGGRSPRAERREGGMLGIMANGLGEGFGGEKEKRKERKTRRLVRLFT